MTRPKIVPASIRLAGWETDVKLVSSEKTFAQLGVHTRAAALT